MEPNCRAENMENHSLPTIPWRKEAELQAPGSASLRPPNASSNALGVPTSDSDVSSVINDLGDAKQLAHTRDRGHFRLATKTGLLVSHAGTSFPDTTSQLGSSIESDILFQKESFEQEDKNDAAKRNTRQTLGRKIRAALQTSSWEREGKRFLPIDKLEQHITRKAIREELERQGSDASLVDKIWEAGPSETSSLTTRRKIFAILVLVDQVPAIIDFINENLYDSDLSFGFREGTGEREGSYDVYRKVKQRDGELDKEVKLQFFQKWKDVTLESFDQNQWQLLAPFFSLVFKDNVKVSHYNLGSHIVLPFIEDNIEDEPPAQHGGSADVRRVKIHRAHQNLCISSNDFIPMTAVPSSTKLRFQHEVETLKRFSGKNNHRHLINLLLTYHYRDHYHLLFPWADGNLLDYWKIKYPRAHTPVRDIKFAKWVGRQWLGVVEGLQAIHTYTADPSLPFHDTQDPTDPRIHGRHGDLKPENILWFKRPHFDEGSTDHFGSFVISDFGLTRFHRELTKSRVNPETLGWSQTYRPPEYDVHKEVSQKCDIWSLGCVLLEFLHWYLLGWKGVEDFQTSRIDDGGSPEMRLDAYYNFVEDDPSQKGTRFKESVKNAFQDLRNDPGTTLFFLDMLDLVQFKLLRMSLAKRASCGEIVESFKNINGRCLRLDGYCTKPVCRPRRSLTDLSELMAIPTASSRQMKKRADMTRHDRLKEDMNFRYTMQNSRHPNRETGSVPRIWELGINTGEATQLARKGGITRDPATEATTMVSDEVDEEVDMNIEQDSQMSSSKNVHFATEDSGIGMNDEDTEGSYSAPTQNDGDISNTDRGELTREEQNMTEDILVNNHTTDQTTPKTATNSTPTSRSPFILNHSSYNKISVFASTRLRPEEPQDMNSPDPQPNAPTEIIEDETLRPLLGSENPGYVETGSSRLRKWYREIFCCY